MCYNYPTVPGGEIAVPCTCNPLQQDLFAPPDARDGRLPRIRGVDLKVLCNLPPRTVSG